MAREPKNQVAGTVLNASGYVTARRQATVSSKFTARVTQVLIEEGMEVDTGQVLARLDDSNISASFDLAQAQLVSAQKGLKETETLLNEAKINYDRSRRLNRVWPARLNSIAAGRWPVRWLPSWNASVRTWTSLPGGLISTASSLRIRSSALLLPV